MYIEGHSTRPRPLLPSRCGGGNEDPTVYPLTRPRILGASKNPAVAGVQLTPVSDETDKCPPTTAMSAEVIVFRRANRENSILFTNRDQTRKATRECGPPATRFHTIIWPPRKLPDGRQIHGGRKLMNRQAGDPQWSVFDGSLATLC